MRKLNAMEDFRRDVGYRVLRREDESIALTATLRDRFHDIVVEVVAEGDSLTIREARADFRASPTPDCKDVSACLDRLVGFRIGPGLNRKLTEIFGGSTGCGNLRTLLQGLLPLALNVRAATGIEDEEEMLDKIHKQLAGTCAGYRV